MKTEKITGQIRAVIPLIAGVLVALNFMSDGDAKVVNDALALILSGAAQVLTHTWSWKQKTARELPNGG